MHSTINTVRVKNSTWVGMQGCFPTGTRAQMAQFGISLYMVTPTHIPYPCLPRSGTGLVWPRHLNKPFIHQHSFILASSISSSSMSRSRNSKSQSRWHGVTTTVRNKIKFINQCWIDHITERKRQQKHNMGKAGCVSREPWSQLLLLWFLAVLVWFDQSIKIDGTRWQLKFYLES